MTRQERELPSITSSRLIVRMAQVDEASQVVKYYLENRDHLANSGPAYPSDYFEEEYWQKLLASSIEEFYDDRSLRLFMFERARDGTEGDVVGSINFSGITRRAAQFCFLGYGLGKSSEGKGYMTEALVVAIAYAFDELNLHRIMANYMPSNQRSGSVLKRLGFVEEGFARQYLRINGQWQDHVMTALTNDHWRDDCA